MQIRFQSIRRAFIGAMTVALAVGCNSKPPACSDEATLTLLRNSLLEDIKKDVAQQAGEPNVIDQPYFKKFFSALKIAITDITSDGYNSDAKKFSCHAHVSVSASNPPIQLDRQFDYSTQNTENSSDHKWVLKVTTQTDIPAAIASALPQVAPTPFKLGPLNLDGVTPTEQASMEPSLETRYGTLSIKDDRQLLFQGKPTTPPLEGNSSLSFQKKFSVNDQDIVLIQDNGGSACPAVFSYAIVSPSGITLTKEFGTCTDLYKSEQRGNRITLTMPGFLGPFEPEKARIAESKKTYSYILENGTLNELSQAK